MIVPPISVSHNATSHKLEQHMAVPSVSYFFLLLFFVTSSSVCASTTSPFVMSGCSPSRSEGVNPQANLRIPIFCLLYP